MFKIYKKSSLSFIEINTELLKVTLCNLGASIYSIYFNNVLMTQTLLTEEEFLNSNIYHGKTIGRSSNRIKGNLIDINGKTYKVMNNEGENTLHGGIDGLSTKYFGFKVTESRNTIKVTFSFLSKDGESGFPGNLMLKVTYEVKNNYIKCIFDAESDQDTICNLTNHTFFTLGEKSLDKCELKIKASNYLHTGLYDLLPMEKREVDKKLDFNNYMPLTKYIDSSEISKGKAKGYDHNFYFDNPSCNKPQLFMKCPKTILSITTNFECCQIYSDNYADRYKWINTNKTNRRSLAIEPQDDILNRKILKKGEKYHRFIKYNFDIN